MKVRAKARGNHKGYSYWKGDVFDWDTKFAPVGDWVDKIQEVAPPPEARKPKAKKAEDLA